MINLEFVQAEVGAVQAFWSGVDPTQQFLNWVTGLYCGASSCWLIHCTLSCDKNNGAACVSNQSELKSKKLSQIPLHGANPGNSKCSLAFLSPCSVPTFFLEVALNPIFLLSNWYTWHFVQIVRNSAFCCQILPLSPQNWPNFFKTGKNHCWLVFFSFFWLESNLWCISLVSVTQHNQPFILDLYNMVFMTGNHIGWLGWLLNLFQQNLFGLHNVITVILFSIQICTTGRITHVIAGKAKFRLVVSLSTNFPSVAGDTALNPPFLHWAHFAIFLRWNTSQRCVVYLYCCSIF